MRKWLIIICVGMLGLSGCAELFTQDAAGMTEDPVPFALMVNGVDVSQTCSKITKNETTYVSAAEVMRALGAVAWELPDGRFALITNEHNLYHTAGTTEVYRKGQADKDDEVFVTLSVPSVVDNGYTYVVPDFFREVLSAQVVLSDDGMAIDLAEPAASVRLQELGSQDKLSYFRAGSAFRYADYLKAHSEVNAQRAVVYVNANLDKPFFTEVETISVPDDILVLCNKYHQLAKDYKPRDLSHITDGYYLRAEAAADYKEMVRAAAQQGYSFQLKSAFRSYETQAQLYNNQVVRVGKDKADYVSARPGHSEHQTGLAIDITQPTGDYGLSSASFEKTPQYTWLCQHAHEFGFILRYLADKTDVTGFVYEPWHFRYVGKDAAKVVYEEKLTYEEYCAMYRLDAD